MKFYIAPYLFKKYFNSCFQATKPIVSIIMFNFCFSLLYVFVFGIVIFFLSDVCVFVVPLQLLPCYNFFSVLLLNETSYPCLLELLPYG